MQKPKYDGDHCAFYEACDTASLPRIGQSGLLILGAVLLDNLEIDRGLDGQMVRSHARQRRVCTATEVTR